MSEPTDMPPRGKAWDDLMLALALLAKHQNNDISPFHCEHDQLNVMADPTKFSESEIQQLEEWGFHAALNEGDDCFYSFRFGSA